MTKNVIKNASLTDTEDTLKSLSYRNCLYKCTHRAVLFQIAQCGAIPILVKMLQNAKGDEEKLSACNTLWTLAFDGDNKKEMNNDDYAIFELKKLLMSENSQIKRAAAGALWECEGKERHAEEKQQADRLQSATGAHARESGTRTLVLNILDTS